MNDATETLNDDLVTADAPVLSPVAAAVLADMLHVEPAELRQDGPTLAEYVEAGYPADTYPPSGYAAVEPIVFQGVPVIADPTFGVPVVVDQHADSGYRPVGGAETQDYLRAKSMGLQGRPSREEVVAFLAAKGA